MSTNPFAPRNLVRKRIIRRNVNYSLMKSFHVTGTLAGIALFPLFLVYALGFVSVWSIAIAMFIMIASLAMYSYYWFQMLDNMKHNARDRKFHNKMLRDEFW